MARATKKPATPRKAAKPPVLNLKATEVTGATSAAGATKPASAAGAAKPASTAKSTSATKPASTAKPTSATKPASAAKPASATAAKPASEKATTSKPENQKPASGKPAQAAPPAKKSSGKSTLVIVSLVALIAAGAGGAFAYKTYGAKYFGIEGAASGEQLTGVIARIDKLEAGIGAQAGKDGKVLALVADSQKQISQNAAALNANNDKLAGLEATAGEIRVALAKAVENSQGPVAAANKLQFDEILQKITGLEADLTGLKSSPVKDSSGDVIELKSRVDALVIRLNAAEDQLVAMNQLIASIKTTQDEMAKAPASSPGAELAKAFTVLRAKITAGKAFASELDNVAGQLPGETALDVLRPFASNGVPTLAGLKVELDKVNLVPDAQVGDQAADKGQKTDGGVFDVVTRRLSGLVKVSKVGETDWQVLKKQAVEGLDSGQLAQAVAMLKGKAGTPPAIEKWLMLADDKVKVEQAIERLTATVMARLTIGN